MPASSVAASGALMPFVLTSWSDSDRSNHAPALSFLEGDTMAERRSDLLGPGVPRDCRLSIR